ncbi:hypothetical protein MASR1M48_17280 [Lactococcus petauri]
MSQEDTKKEEKKTVVRVVCKVCHGMAGIETPSGDTRDCPNRKCVNGFMEVPSE